MTQKVKDIMVREVITIEANATIREAVMLMNNREIGCLIVLQEGKPTGIVTERDMMKRVLVNARNPMLTLVNEIMSKPLVFAEPDTDIGDTVKLMFERKIKKLPVIENGRLVGLVTLTDLVRSPEVTEWLREIPLEDTPRRMKKVIDSYSSSTSHLQKKCPLIADGGISMKCQEEKCMWWLEDECVVLKLTKQLLETRAHKNEEG